MTGREGSDGPHKPAIGRAVPRKEDPPLLRGRARFVDDVRLDRMLHGVFLRSPHPHAEIGAIDPSAALAAGARAVLTADDLSFAGRDFVVRYWHAAIRGGTQPFLARAWVRYVGEAVALVVADDAYRAEDLAALVEIDYRPLEAVADVAAARAGGAPALHDSWTGNIAARFSYARGDAARALEGAARRVVHRTRFARQIPLPLETRGAVADFDRARGRLTIRLSTQAHYNVRENLASLLDLPESAVRVICEDVGGGFGAKSRCYGEEIVLAEASRVLGRPVKWIEDRRENMLATTHSRGIDTALELGLAADGRFQALRATVVLDVGAYVFTSGIATAEFCGALIPGAYRIPDFSVEVLAVGTNKTPAATYRGAGQPEAALAIETLVDRAALALGMDAVALRRRNLVRPGDLPYATGTGFGGGDFAFHGGDFPALLDRVRAESGYREAVETRPDGARIAWGLAGGVDVSGVVNFESAGIRIDPSGDVFVRSGMSSQGQGQATIFAQIAAKRSAPGSTGSRSRSATRRCSRSDAAPSPAAARSWAAARCSRRRGPCGHAFSPSPRNSSRTRPPGSTSPADESCGAAAPTPGSGSAMRRARPLPAGRCSTARRGSRPRPCGAPSDRRRSPSRSTRRGWRSIRRPVRSKSWSMRSATTSGGRSTRRSSGARSRAGRSRGSPTHC